MPRLGRFRCSFDTWRVPETEEHVEESSNISDPDVELREWKPVEGRACPDVNVVFVDGVRRTENLIYIENDAGIREGAFVSIAAGALLMRQGGINPVQDALLSSTVRRYLFVRGNVDLEEEKLRFEVGSVGLEFEIRCVGEEEEISPQVNRVMADLEMAVAERAFRSAKPDLMVTDGTVHYSAAIRSLPFVGYVKKQRRMYIPTERRHVLRELRVGERTPLVLIHSQPTMESPESSSLDKLTWYVRISEDEGISGIARLEISAGVGLKRAVEIADMTAWLIPRFASTEFTDRRAPHNLLPIKHLENALRRRLGSQTLIRRAIVSELTRSS